MSDSNKEAGIFFVLVKENLRFLRDTLFNKVVEIDIILI